MSKRKACDDDVASSPQVAILPASPLLDLPPEIWNMITTKLEPVERVSARFAGRELWALVPRKKIVRPRRHIAYAAAYDDRKLTHVMWLLDRTKKSCRFDACAEGAAAGNQVAVLTYLSFFEHTFGTRSFELAAERGNLEALAWLLEHGVTLPAPTYEICHSAARGGHWHVLQWLIRNGFCKHATCGCELGAAETGQVSVLEWLEFKRIFMYYPNQLARTAAKAGQTKILTWMATSQYAHALDNKNLYYDALEAGQLEAMLWFEEWFVPHVFGPREPS